MTIKEQVAEHLEHSGNTHFEDAHHVIHMCESSEGFDYNIYPLHTRPDDDGEFNDNLMLDGGTFEIEDALEAVENALEESEYFYSIHGK